MRAADALRLAAVLGVLPLLIGIGLERTGSDGAAQATPGFQVYHLASEVEGEAFREVFIVHDLSPGFVAATARLDIRVNGQPLAVAWDDPDGVLSVDDRFSFVQEAFDQKQLLTALFEDRQVMECRFGGGAGLGILPDEWRALGMPEEVRCLRLVDDQ